MKESIFNIYLEIDGKTLLFNGLYCGLCEIDETYRTTLDKINKNVELNEIETAVLNTALSAGFIIDDELDELELLKLNKYKRKFDDSAITITIAPTLACNFQCIYCYEDNRTGKMTVETEEKICEYIQKKADRLDSLGITWYGGEPLLAKEIIYRMSEKIVKTCIENGISYHASMITNGSLLSQLDVVELKKYHIDTVQITLDGPADIHNMRRKCSSIADNFKVIVDNINLLLGEDFNLHIRVNVDKNNYSRLEEFLQYLDVHLISKKVNIGFSKVSACTDACASVAEDCFDAEEFSHEYFNLYSLIEKYGFDDGTPLRYARPKVNYCGADVYGSFVVDAEGYVYKCWHDVGDEKRSLGSVENIDGALMSPRASKWLFHDALQNENCRACKVLPLCMGGCPSQAFYEQSSLVCDEIKYNISEILIQNYYRKINERR